jgi:glycosyltransferase involved in cell wall biosynthesis
MPSEKPAIRAPIPRVSICIPSYNGANYIGNAIDSVLAQDYPNLELVVADDASTDDTRAIVQCFSDPRIRLVPGKTNLGMGPNWNRCLRESRGNYIKILPQDDLLRPDCIRRQIEVLDADSEMHLAFVFSARSIIGASGRAYFQRRYSRWPSGPVASRELIRRAARGGTNPVGEPGAVLFRREAALFAGEFDGSSPFVVDIDYWVRLLQWGAAYYLGDALASFRVSSLSHSVVYQRRQCDEYRRFLDRLAAMPDSPVTPMDCAIGSIRAAVNMKARSVFYRLAAR